LKGKIKAAQNAGKVLLWQSTAIDGHAAPANIANLLLVNNLYLFIL